MKLRGTTWLILGIGIFVIATALVYFMYQDKVAERQAAEDTRMAIEETQLPGLLADKQALEGELAQKEDEITQWEAEISQLELLLAQTEQEVGKAREGFPALVSSINYDELLFTLASASSVQITELDSSEVVSIEVDGNAFSTTSFGLKVQGDLTDILDFINALTTDDAFRTAVMEPVNLSIPETLTDEQIEELKDALREEIRAAALEEITTQQILDFILEAILEVTGIEIDTFLVEDMAETVKSRIDGSLEGGYDDLLSEKLAEFIVESIPDTVLQEIIAPLAEEIGKLVAPVQVIQISPMMRNWSPGNNWTIIDQFQGMGGGNDSDKTLTYVTDVDLSNLSEQIVTISWDQDESGSLEPDDTLYFAVSGDGGASWSTYEEAFSNDAPQASYTYNIPEEYLTSQFRIRFLWDADERSEYCFIENIRIATEEGEELDFDYNALVELLGEDLAALLSEQIVGSMPGEIANILDEFIAGLVGAKMENLITGPVEVILSELIEQEIEKAQKPEVNIVMVVYANQREGE